MGNTAIEDVSVSPAGVSKWLPSSLCTVDPTSMHANPTTTLEKRGSGREKERGRVKEKGREKEGRASRLPPERGLAHTKQTH